MTFTMLAAHDGLLAVASASRSLAVGNAVIAVDPAVGAVASQAWTNRLLRARMLEALAAGERPSEVVAMVPGWDDGAELRQVAALLPTGEGAARTGTDVTAWSGALVRPGLVVLGNLLTGPEVLDAVASAYGAGREPSPGSDAEAVAGLARRVLAAMLAGEEAGGDRRGRQSAAVVVTRTRAERTVPPELDIDLRVDDAAHPIRELTRLVEMQVSSFGEAWPGARSAFERTDGA